MFVSRWSIRRKLLVCLTIVLAIVAALAYSGFSGGYSYRELAWTIRVRANDLKLAGELTESLGDLRVSLSQGREFLALSGMDQMAIRDRFYDRLPAVERDLFNYRRNLEQNRLTDARQELDWLNETLGKNLIGRARIARPEKQGGSSRG